MKETAVIAFIFLLLFIGWRFQSIQERDTFNKFRDPNTPAATLSDAMFSDLRITTK